MLFVSKTARKYCCWSQHKKVGPYYLKLCLWNCVCLWSSGCENFTLGCWYKVRRLSEPTDIKLKAKCFWLTIFPRCYSQHFISTEVNKKERENQGLWLVSYTGPDNHNLHQFEVVPKGRIFNTEWKSLHLS